MIRVSELKLPLDAGKGTLEKKLAKALRIPAEEIKGYRIFKRSLDARKKENIRCLFIMIVSPHCFLCSVDSLYHIRYPISI